MINLILNERDRILLELLSKPCFQIGLNAEELVSYLWHASCQGKVKIYSLEQGIRRRLKQLCDQKLISVVRFCNEPKRCYYLTPEGLEEVNERSVCPIKLKNRAQNMGYVKHARLTARAMLSLYLGTLNSQETIDSEFTEERLVLRHGQYFVPDAILGVHGRAENYIFYCEIDRVTETHGDFKGKIKNYLEFFKGAGSGEFLEHVLTIATTLERTRGLLKTTQEVILREQMGPLAGRFRFSYLPLIEKKDLSWGWIDGTFKGSPREKDFQKGVL